SPLCGNDSDNTCYNTPQQPRGAGFALYLMGGASRTVPSERRSLLPIARRRWASRSTRKQTEESRKVKCKTKDSLQRRQRSQFKPALHPRTQTESLNQSLQRPLKEEGWKTKPL